MTSLLECRELSRTFGGLKAVDTVSLTLEGGKILGVIGPNGAGKTTLLSMVAGTVVPSSGVVAIEGREVNELPAHRRAQLGMRRTFQVASVYPKLTVLENLLAAIPPGKGESLLSVIGPGRRWRAAERENVMRARSLLDRFGLSKKEDIYAGELSGGERRIVEILRVTSVPVKLLLLDEPMAGVNPALMTVIEDYLQEIAEQGAALLMIEHRLDSVRRICDWVVAMANGAVISEGAFADVSGDEAVIGAYIAG